MDALYYLSAATVARLIRDRQLSSEEVIRAHLHRSHTNCHGPGLSR